MATRTRDAPPCGPVGRTCGEPDEIKTRTHLEDITNRAGEPESALSPPEAAVGDRPCSTVTQECSSAWGATKQMISGGHVRFLCSPARVIHPRPGPSVRADEQTEPRQVPTPALRFMNSAAIGSPAASGVVVVVHEAGLVAQRERVVHTITIRSVVVVVRVPAASSSHST